MFEKKTETFTAGNSKISYAFIPWDSDFFKNKTYEIQEVEVDPSDDAMEIFVKFKDELELKKGDLLFAKRSVDQLKHIRNLADMGFYFIEESIVTNIDVTKWSGRPEDNNKIYSYRKIQEEEVEEVAKISEVSFGIDRYHKDIFLSEEGANLRSYTWVKNSFRSGEDIFVFVDESDKIAGFFIAKTHGKESDIRIIALAPNARGKGLGKPLYIQMIETLKSAGIETILAQISLNNIIVLNIYSYLGASFQEPEIILHNVIK